MGNAVSIAFLTVLVLLTLIAVRTWYQRRGAAVDEAQERVFRRFVLGLLVFWMVAVAGFLWGLGWPREAAKVIGLMSDERLKLAMVCPQRERGSLREHHVGDQGRFIERHLFAAG